MEDKEEDSFNDGSDEQNDSEEEEEEQWRNTRGASGPHDNEEVEYMQRQLQQQQQEPAEINSRLLELKAQLDSLVAETSNEKALTDKADEARVIDAEQKAFYEQDIEAKTQELAELEEKINTLMVEGRMYQLASREFDFPLKETWVQKPEQALVVDLADICKKLDQAVYGITASEKLTSSGANAATAAMTGDKASIGEIEVIHVDSQGREVGKTNIPINPITTLEEVLLSACNYWSLNSKNCELENSQGRKLVRRDGVPAATTQLILRDISLEEEETMGGGEDAKANGTTNDFSLLAAASNMDGAGGGSMNPPQYAANSQVDGGASTGISESGTSAGNIQAGKDLINTRDARMCHHLEFLVVILLASTFAAMSLEFRRVYESYLARESVKRLFADQPVLDPNITSLSYNFFDIHSEKSMWRWMDQVATIYNASSPFPSNCSTTGLMVTAMTISQLRVFGNTNCVQLSGAAKNCYAAFGGVQQQFPYLGASFPSNPAVAKAFVYNPNALTEAQAGACSAWPSLVSDSFPGLYAYYPARQLDFFSMEFSRLNMSAEIAALDLYDWVDDGTRLVTLEFTTYEQFSGSFVNVMAVFEFLPEGGVFPKWISIPFFFQVNDDVFDLLFLILTMVLIGICFILYVLGYRQTNARFHLLIDALLVVFVALYYTGNQQMDHWIELCESSLAKSLSSSGTDFRGMAFQSQLVGNLEGVIVILLAFRLLKHLDGSPSTSVIYRALTNSFAQYLSLGVVILVVVSSLALMAHFIFGRTSFDFFVVDLAYASIWISFTTANSGAYVGTANWGAVVLSLVAFVLFFLVLFFSCFSVTASAYFNVRDEVRSQGYYWMQSTRDSKIHSKSDHHEDEDLTKYYAEEVVENSGAIGGTNAQIRKRKFQAAGRKFGE